MIKLVRGDHIVIGITEENMMQLVSGQVIQWPATQIGCDDEGKFFYFMQVRDDDDMLERLKRAGYHIDGEGNGERRP